ncbi:hypothetical protein EVAR_9338_1 [Eumeta japonica]|uniref:Uncharacterized protein n=1 Tax=Eumeta variegata TaxID=151549 RepID=A0A4C1YTU8_EUMVA|nr:hypothetical protein EVAR_9338_1 [Eumeta japonica]
MCWKNCLESFFAYEDAVADDNVTGTEYMIDDGNKSEITMNEVMKALKYMKIGKAAGYDKTREVLNAADINISFRAGRRGPLAGRPSRSGARRPAHARARPPAWGLLC